mgnify:CR=1
MVDADEDAVGTRWGSYLQKSPSHARVASMLRIRLQRVGKKHDPSYRIVLTDSKNSTKSGRFLEILGNHNARAGKSVFEGERIKHWISKGARPTDSLHNLLVRKAVIVGKKIAVHSHGKASGDKVAVDKKA